MSEFDKRTHILDDKGLRVIKEQPYRIRMKQGWPNLFVRDDKCYYENGEPYGQAAPEEWKAMYPDHFKVEVKKVELPIEPKKSKRGRPKKEE
ncbi:MAG: hypothetical protein GY861_08355 [bacterium]|nr:hypothetical protein [bacterium]